MDGHSFRILCIIHFSRFTDRRLFGRRRPARAYIFLLHHWRAQLSAQSSLHYYYYLTTMSVIRISEGREKKRKKKLDLTCSPFFLLFPASLLILSSSNRDEMTQVYLIFNFRSVGKLKFFFSSPLICYTFLLCIYKPLFFALFCFWDSIQSSISSSIKSSINSC